MDEPYTGTYRVVRFFKEEGLIFHPSEVVKTGLSLEEAQAHCKSPESSSSTCTTEEGHRRTIKRGDWMDGYDKESRPVTLSANRPGA